MTPSTDHYHQLDPSKRRVRVLCSGKVIADSTRTILLKEVGARIYDPVFYFPPDDVDQARLEKSASRTSCPIKGEASYWSTHDGEDLIDDVAWSYEHPIDYSRPIAGHVAFDPRYVTFELNPTREG